MVHISFALLTHLGLTHEAIIHESKGRELDVEILINRESLARLLYKIMVGHDDLRGGNGGNGFLWQRENEEEVVQTLLNSKPLTMWVEELRCNGNKDVAKPRDKRAVSTPASFPTAIEHRFFGRVYYPDKSTNAPALKEGGGDDVNTLEVSQPEDDAFSGLSRTLNGDEGSAIGYELAGRKKGRRKIQKQGAKVRKQKKEEQDKFKDEQQLKANAAKEGKLPPQEWIVRDPNVVAKFRREHTILKMHFQIESAHRHPKVEKLMKNLLATEQIEGINVKTLRDQVDMAEARHQIELDSIYEKFLNRAWVDGQTSRKEAVGQAVPSEASPAEHSACKTSSDEPTPVVARFFSMPQEESVRICRANSAVTQRFCDGIRPGSKRNREDLQVRVLTIARPSSCLLPGKRLKYCANLSRLRLKLSERGSKESRWKPQKGQEGSSTSVVKESVVRHGRKPSGMKKSGYRKRKELAESIRGQSPSNGDFRA